MASKEQQPAATATGKPPTICNRLQKAFHSRPAFRPLFRLTGRAQDGEAHGAPATGTGPGGAPAAAATHGGAPPPPILLPAASPVGKAPAPTPPVTLLPAQAPQKPAAAKGADGKAQREGQVPAVSIPAAATNVAEKKQAAATAGGMPVPVPPPAVVAGRTPAADAKAGDKAKTRVVSRVRKAMASSK